MSTEQARPEAVEVVAPEESGAQSRPGDALTRALLASVFVIAACGLVYELIAAADEHGMAMVFTGRRHFRH